MRSAFLTPLIVFLSCHAPLHENSNSVKTDTLAQEIINPIVDSNLERKIIDTLVKLSMVKEDKRYIDSVNHTKQGLRIGFDTVINYYAADGGPLIDVTVWYSKEALDSGKFHDEFYIDPKTFDIKVCDDQNDTIWTVPDYLKQHPELSK